MKISFKKYSLHSAFTMLELVFVIVVIGVLAAAIIPSTRTNPLQEAAIQVFSDIRYTQHLAMMDDKFDSSDANWYKNKWQLIFGKSNSSAKDSGGYFAYTIFSDYLATSTGNPDLVEIAVNPSDNSKVLSGGFSGGIDWEDSQATKKLNIGYSYGIDNVTQSGCGGNRIAFDNLGRPFGGSDSSWTSSVDGVLTQTCTFTLHAGSDSIRIAIKPETGFACILKDDGSCIKY